MATVTLTYFDFPGGRGEDCRIALHLAGVPFVDDRVGADWAKRRDETPFGALPVLSVEGKGSIGQSNAIVGYIGREHGLLPTDSWERARHEAILGAAEDLRALVDVTLDLDPEAKRKAREHLATVDVPAWAGRVERLLGDGPFFGGRELSVADLKLYVVMRWFTGGKLDHVPTDVFAPFPKLTRLYAAVENHPGVKSWYAKR